MCKKVKNTGTIRTLASSLGLKGEGDTDFGIVAPGGKLPFIGADDPSLLSSREWAQGYNTRTERVLDKDGHLLDDRGIFVVSAFYEENKSFKFGDPTFIPVVHLNYNRYSILTVPANNIISKVHHRMPAYLRDNWKNFLNDKGSVREILSEFI